MTEEALSFVRSGAGDARLPVRRRAFMRYLGERHEIVVVLPDEPLTGVEPARLRRAFEDSYFQQFGRTIAKLDVEALSWSVIVQTAGAEVRLAEAVRPTPLAGNSVARALLDPGTGERINALIVRRDQLPVGT